MDKARIQRKNNVHIRGNPAAQNSLIFVHGFGTDQSVWDGIVPEFSGDYRVITFDNVGSGGSEPSAFIQHRYLGLQGYANDLLEICRAYAVGKSCVVGHSSGAMIGALAAVADPSLFSKLALLSASPRYLNDGEYIGGFTDRDLRDTYSAVVRNLPDWIDTITPKILGGLEQPELARHFAETLLGIKPENVLTDLCAILQSDCREEIKRISIPTLIIQSTEDYFVPAAVAYYLYRNIADSTLAIIPARGHFPHLSAPAEVAAALRGFL